MEATFGDRYVSGQVKRENTIRIKSVRRLVRCSDKDCDCTFSSASMPIMSESTDEIRDNSSFIFSCPAFSNTFANIIILISFDLKGIWPASYPNEQLEQAITTDRTLKQTIFPPKFQIFPVRNYPVQMIERRAQNWADSLAIFNSKNLYHAWVIIRVNYNRSCNKFKLLKSGEKNKYKTSQYWCWRGCLAQIQN